MPIPDPRSLDNFALESCHQALIPVSTQSLTKLLPLLGLIPSSNSIFAEAKPTKHLEI